MIKMRFFIILILIIGIYLWDEYIPYDTSSRSDSGDKSSIRNCQDTSYKYFIHYVAGHEVTFEKFINHDNAEPLINLLIEKGEGNKAAYMDHLGFYFFFVACAGLSIIIFIFNWICWKNQCCCDIYIIQPIKD